MADYQDDLTASKTEGFKVGEKKTIEEYTKLGMLVFSLSLFVQYISVANDSDAPYLMHIL